MTVKMLHSFFFCSRNALATAVVVTQLVERSLLTAEICGLNPVIGKICIDRLLPTVLKKTKIKSKIGRGWPIFEKTMLQPIFVWQTSKCMSPVCIVGSYY